jgi:hypothetical protein
MAEHQQLVTQTMPEKRRKPPFREQAKPFFATASYVQPVAPARKRSADRIT